jgi:hypothetical protein
MLLTLVVITTIYDNDGGGDDDYTRGLFRWVLTNEMDSECVYVYVYLIIIGSLIFLHLK